MRVISFPPLASPRQRSNDLVFIDRIQHVLKGDAILSFFLQGFLSLPVLILRTRVTGAT